MKAHVPQPVHESYKRHRREFAWQILLPVVLSTLSFIALIVLIYFATFEGNGDVARWAAISTMWILIPVLLAGLVLLLLIGALVYGMKRLLAITPRYTGMAQDYVHKAASYIKRFADMVVRPVLFLDGIGAGIRRLVGRK